MDKISKKTIGGMVLATILVAGMFAFMPQSATADLTALDKFGRIIELLIEIKNLLLDPNFGLEEIKREVRIIETNVTSPDHGLKEIKREVRNIEGNVTSPDFGLEEIKKEVRGIEGNITSPDFGLEEIKKEIKDIGLAGGVLSLNKTLEDGGGSVEWNFTSPTDAVITSIWVTTIGTDGSGDFCLNEMDFVIDSTFIDYRSNPSFCFSSNNDEMRDLLRRAEQDTTTPVGWGPIPIEAGSSFIMEFEENTSNNVELFVIISFQGGLGATLE